MEPNIIMLLFPAASQLTSLRKLAMESHAPEVFLWQPLCDWAAFSWTILFWSGQDGFGNILCSPSVLNPLTHGFRLSISSVTLTRSRKSPTCYSSDCDRAMYFLCFGEPLRSLNSFQIAPCLAEVPIPSRNLFKKGVYELNGQDCDWGRRRNKWGGESGHSKETEKSGMYISETYGWKL